MSIKKDDTVVVLTGTDSNKSGKVLDVFRAKNRALVEGVNVVKKTQKRNQSQDNPQGGIIEIESAIHLSNLALFCPTCKKGVKTRVERSSDGKGQRICKKCGHNFDA
jgi:large subunit ribosomal protein L24